MNDFSQLYWQLDSTTKTNEKVKALVNYLEAAPPRDAVWAIWFLAGNRIRRLLPVRRMSEWAMDLAGLPDWLFAECYDRVGDMAETISLVLPPPSEPRTISLADLIDEKLLPLRNSTVEQQKQVVTALWEKFERPERFVLGKLITGGFRVGVSRRLLQRAIAQWTGITTTTIAHRMMGNWDADLEFFQRLIDPHDDGSAVKSQPYPFFLANPLSEQADLFQPPFGDANEWVAEWKWDGIRAQVIKRSSEVYIWSRGEELVTHQFPEIEEAARALPDGVVLDGELLAWSEDNDLPLDFQRLQKRLGRKTVGAKTRRDSPVVMLAFDLIEFAGLDIRGWELVRRQQQLSELIQDLKTESGRGNFLFPEMENTSVAIRLPPPVKGRSWEAWAEQRQCSKEFNAEGLMLKRKSSAYQVNRPVGDWWKWKVDPYTIDAVLIYAQRGHGRRASLYSDYTFAVWNESELVPFAKAYSGLTDKEMREVDAFVRKNTNEAFGPVRSVTPELVFELAFENIQISTRHKSGIAVRFPRISRWRHDKKPEDADTLENIKAMIK